MRVLIACEFSGIVRESFRSRGHDAWSCDLLPTEIPGQHIQGDTLSILDQHWDLMIAHPPCTFLCNSGVRWLYGGGRRNGAPPEIKRWQDMESAARFFKTLLDAPIPRICLENPIIHGYAKKIIGADHSQTIQPFYFGHGETKTTCLWLKNLPLLNGTNLVTGRAQRVFHESPGPDRWKNRSRTMKGIAEAMAAQWGNLKPVDL